MSKELQNAPLYELAALIYRDWSNVYYGAEPYLKAMQTLNSIHDPYLLDTGKSIVLYFLANAQTWRGETARTIKAELKRRANI